MRPVVIIAASACALAGAGLAGLVLLRPAPALVAPAPLAAAKPFSMEDFRRNSRNSDYSAWTERQRQAFKDCPKCPPLPLPDIPREEPAFEDVAPPKQELPSRRIVPGAKPLPPHLLPYVSPFVSPQPQPRPKPAKAKGWDI